MGLVLGVTLYAYIVGHYHTLVVVDELLVVGYCAVPTHSVAVGAVGDGIAGVGVNVALDSGDNFIIRF